MKRLVIVAIAVAAIAVSVVDRRNGIGVAVGIVAGTWFFLQAVTTGGGIASVRLTRDPNEPRRPPADPSGSIGMGLAAAGIAAAVLANPNYAPFHVYFVFFLVAGLLIALGYAGKTVVTDFLARRTGGGGGRGAPL